MAFRITSVRHIVAVLLALQFGLVAGNAGAINMRHDARAADYLALARNAAPFAAGKAYPDFAPVAAVGEPATGGGEPLMDPVGSGTLIAPRWVLTAVHILIDPEAPTEFLPELEVRFGPNADATDLAFAVVEIHTPRPLSSGIYMPHVDEEREFSDREEWASNAADIALLKLDRPVTGIHPATLAATTPPTGSRIFVVGYGMTTTGDVIHEDRWDDRVLRRAGENILDRVVARSPFSGRTDEGGLLAYDFDNGSRGRNSLGRHIDPDLIFPAQSGPSDAAPLPLEAAAMPGDSGGPAFARVDGRWVVIGVCNSGTDWPLDGDDPVPQYGDVLFYTNVPNHLAWIRRIAR